MRTTRRQFALGLGLALPATALARSAGAPQDDKGAEPAEMGLHGTLILVRHTEKAKDDPVDPSLSEAGKKRAKDLARLFQRTGVTALLHTEYKRTRDTLAPLAGAMGLDSEVIGASEMPLWIERLRGAKAGEVIAVAGHSNTIPALAHAFGILLPDLDPPSKGMKVPHGNLPHDAYDRVHVLTPDPHGNSATLVELRYGEPSPE